MATEELEPERVVQEFHRRILSEQDLDAAEDLLTPDYVEHNPILPDGVIRGRDEMVAFWSEMFDGVSDMEITEQEIVSEGNTVVTRHTGRGRHDGEFMGIEPTGESFEMEGIDLYHVEDGKLTEAWVAMDSMQLLEQLGVAPEAPVGD